MHDLIAELGQMDFGAASRALVLTAGEDGPAGPTCQRAQLHDGVADHFCTLAKKATADVIKRVAASDAAVQAYDPAVEAAPHEIECFDASTCQPILAHISALDGHANLPIFQADDAFLKALRYYAVAITPPNGQPVHFIRQFGPKHELGRSRFTALMFADGTYHQVKEKTFLFDGEIDCIASGTAVLILKRNAFYSIFRFWDTVKAEGAKNLQAVADLGIIDNFEDFGSACTRHTHKLAKLNSIVRKGYLATVTIEQIRTVVQQMGLKIEIRKCGKHHKMVYDSSDPWLLLKVLDDDYFQSQMTGRKYVSNAKRDVS